PALGLTTSSSKMISLPCAMALTHCSQNFRGKRIRGQKLSRLINDRFLECPSDAESDHSLPFGGNLVFNAGVVSEYQPEGNVDHRQLDAEFQPDRRTDVLRQSQFTPRSADDLEALRLSLHEDPVKADGEA